MKVTSTETVSFPQFNWGITKGESVELPERLKDNHEVILAHPAIHPVEDEKPTGKDKKSDEQKNK